MLKILSRHQINSNAWDACVATSPQRMLYGYSWYLDAVLPASMWKWMGIVLADETGGYQAVMPVPLRQKGLAGIAVEWVVHQPFFCQLLGVFSRENTAELTADFWGIVQQTFRYGSTISVRQQPENPLLFDAVRRTSTHVLNLSVDYATLYQRYSSDRKRNLRRAQATGWTIIESADIEPLLALFQENHASDIDGGVADWAYDILRNLVAELSKRGLAMLQYAVLDNRIEAGSLFVREGNRIVYLFNASSETGRRGNARTLLIDQMIQANAGYFDADEPLIFDFESPKKLSIRQFYQSFGTSEEPFWEVYWNRLSRIERMLLVLRKNIN